MSDDTERARGLLSPELENYSIEAKDTISYLFSFVAAPGLNVEKKDSYLQGRKSTNHFIFE